MTQLQSGYFPTSSNATPTGVPKKVAVDNPYVTKEEYITTIEASGLGIDVTNVLYTSGELDRILLRASAWVNRYCNRWFDTQTIDETMTRFYVRPYNPQLVTVKLSNRPYQRINSVWIQVLKWFIQVDVTSPGNYLQDFPDYGYYKIVPVLSTAGTGMGSPIPAAILDRAPLGILWTNYTFGYGTPLIAQVLAGDATFKIYQAPLGNRLWAKDMGVSVYKNATLVTPTLYTVDWISGIITFATANIVNDVITATFTTNESLPADIKEAVILLVSHMIGQARDNALGADSYGIQTYNVSFGQKSKVKERVEELLEPYSNQMPVLL